MRCRNRAIPKVEYTCAGYCSVKAPAGTSKDPAVVSERIAYSAVVAKNGTEQRTATK
jgi:hypothetical protein